VLPVAIYARLSLDTEGQGLGVARQIEDCKRIAAGRRWRVAQTYTDNSVSAYKRRVRRPEFEQMLVDLAEGRLGGVVVYDCDRLARQPRDLERLIELYDTQPLVFATAQADIDLSSPDGRFMARLMVNFASKSSADTGRRVARKHLELAQAGIPVGGSRPFGWLPDKRTLDPVESRLIHDAARDLLAGKGMNTICRDWNAAGITTPRGNAWVKPVFRNLMLSPRLAGYRVYRHEIALDATGQPVKGRYEAVLDVATWEAVKALLTDPTRSGPHVHVGGRKYLLSGIARCALCSSVLQGNADTRWNTFFYCCRGCGKVGISGPKTDDLITRLVIAYLSEREVEPQSQTWLHETDLSDIMQRISDLMAEYTAKRLSGQVVFAAVERLEAEAKTLRNDHAAWLRDQIAVGSRPTNVAGAWPDLKIEQRRAVIEGVMQAVAIHPAAARGGKFDPERIELVWRGRQRSEPRPHPIVQAQP
jgi:site-specific DNA recombinase